MYPSLNASCSFGWSPVGSPVINGVTAPLIGSTSAMRELLFCPLCWCVAWFESVTNSLPPAKPRSNAISTAGPSGCRPPFCVGFARGPRISFPFLLKTRMSGVKGFLGSKSPVPYADWSLQRLGKPWPDSSTNTSKLSLSPRNVSPVGKFRPFAKTDTLNCESRMMSSPLPGLKNTSSPGHSGFGTVDCDLAGDGCRGTISTAVSNEGSTNRTSDPRRGCKVITSLHSEEVGRTLEGAKAGYAWPFVTQERFGERAQTWGDYEQMAPDRESTRNRKVAEGFDLPPAT